MNANTEAKIEYYDGVLHVCLKCKCCEFVLTHEVEDEWVKAYLLDALEKMSIIFDGKKNDLSME